VKIRITLLQFGSRVSIVAKLCFSANKVFFKNFFYSYVHTMFGSFLPLPAHFQAETVLPLSLILLKTEYKY
jgi:hypothetical protein